MDMINETNSVWLAAPSYSTLASGCALRYCATVICECGYSSSTTCTSVYCSNSNCGFIHLG